MYLHIIYVYIHTYIYIYLYLIIDIRDIVCKGRDTCNRDQGIRRKTHVRITCTVMRVTVFVSIFFFPFISEFSRVSRAYGTTLEGFFLFVFRYRDRKPVV